VRRIHAMKRRAIGTIVASAVLSLSLASYAGAADGRGTTRIEAGWLDEVVGWFSKIVLGDKDGRTEVKPVAPGGTGGASLDGGGCLDPLGRPGACV
jgi:hypothetical protein